MKAFPRKKYVDVRFTFQESSDDENSDYTVVQLHSINIVNSELDRKALEFIAEDWAQSDRYWVTICNGIIDMFGGKTFRNNI